MDNVNLTSLEEIATPTTKLEADVMLEEVYQLDQRIKEEEAQRDQFIDVYKAEIERQEQKIATASMQCEEAIKPLQAKRQAFELLLRQFTEANVTDKKRSIALPTAKMQLTKRQPKIFTDDLKEASSSNERLKELIKRIAPDCIKLEIVEKSDWAKFKTKLTTDGEIVSLKDTGEVIEELRAQQLPDDFKIKFNG